MNIPKDVQTALQNFAHDALLPILIPIALIILISLGLLAIAWVVSLFLLVADSISVVAKIVWFLALTCLAPIAIPVYLILRHRRRSQA